MPRKKRKSSSSPPPVSDEEQDWKEIERYVRQLPARSGLFLVFTGVVGGFFIPGLPGMGIALLGGMIAAPKTVWLQEMDGWLKKQSPQLRAEAFRFVHRFFHDLDARFPKKKP